MTNITEKLNSLSKEITKNGTEKMLKKETDEKVIEEVIDNDDATTEEFVKQVVEVLMTGPTGTGYESIRQQFDIRMPDGENQVVTMWPGHTLPKLQEMLNRKFGTKCIMLGVIESGTTVWPHGKENQNIGMFNTRSYRQMLSTCFFPLYYTIC